MAFSLFNFGAKAANTKNQVVEIPLKQIEPNRYQPRQVFDKVQIQELAHTIEEHGLLQPIILREYKAAKYEIIAGERRFRAMELLGWEAAPAIVEKMSDKESASLALIENLQRSQLSSVEEARAYKKLMDLNNLTQVALAKGVGKSQSAVANKLRLLNLIEPVQNAILDGLITERHGRALLGLTDDQQRKLLMRVVNEKLTVRQTEEAVAALQGEVLPTPAASAASITPAPASAATAPATASAPVKQPQAKKAAPKKKAKISVSDPQIALNTIKKSVKLVKDNGFKTTVRQKKLPDGYQLTITVKPQATDHQDGEK
ncbi:ParB/RepB/Spo0J family partition protein [Limosilactobacillus ingluviei]|uniref:ParB/RepB/Spo0J family partition protein n=1 Tax=Limosilactobacillus ingluviei TaxID=148604 RepID=UPI0024B9A598|nr:ParB/RepB/Spo0J family partition protein [Limosilactobacillus ingluviei]